MILSKQDKKEIYEDVMSAFYKIVLEKFEQFTNEQIFKAAENKFGLTNDIREAGYILPNGNMLDFSGRHEMAPNADTSDLRGRRSTDHRNIDSITFDSEDNLTGIETDMYDFINRGAIRIDAAVGSIHLNQKPTQEQCAVLRKIIVKNDSIYVEFGSDDIDCWAEYENAKPSKILADINRYFDEGIKPETTNMF